LYSWVKEGHRHGAGVVLKLIGWLARPFLVLVMLEQPAMKFGLI